MLTQNDCLMISLRRFYSNKEELLENKIKPILEGKSKISLRLIEHFIIKYCKDNFTIYTKKNGEMFIVHHDYKAQLDSYSKDQFDPFKRANHIIFQYGIKKFYYSNKIEMNGLDVNTQIIMHDHSIKNIKDIEINDVILGLNGIPNKVINIYEWNNENTIYLELEHNTGLNISLQLETTIAQLNFFKWIISNGILDYIESHFNTIKEATKGVTIIATPKIVDKDLQITINVKSS